MDRNGYRMRIGIVKLAGTVSEGILNTGKPCRLMEPAHFYCSADFHDKRTLILLITEARERLERDSGQTGLCALAEESRRVRHFLALGRMVEAAAAVCFL
ncbi:MAG: hypothetical protein ACLUOI_18760 [Eisenbergiella sp.]